MNGSKNVTVSGQLMLRIGDQELDLGRITVPVTVEATPSGDLTMTAPTAGVREVVQEVFNLQAVTPDDAAPAEKGATT